MAAVESAGSARAAPHAAGLLGGFLLWLLT
jgi:hypothetical protein